MSKFRIAICLSMLAVLLLASCAPPAPAEPPAETEAVPAAPEATEAPAEPAAPEAPAETAAPAEAPAPVEPGAFVEVPREETVIFENTNGRNPVPDNYNPYISNQYLQWGFW